MVDVESETGFLARNVTCDEGKLYRDIVSDVVKTLISREPSHNLDMVPPALDSIRSHRNVRLSDYLKEYNISIEYCEALLCENMQVESVPGKYHEAMLKELQSMAKHIA